MPGWIEPQWVIATFVAFSIAAGVAMSLFINRRIVGLEFRVKSLTERVTPISAAFRSELIRELTHNHTPELDSLLADLEAGVNLTPARETRLYQLLKERVIDFDDPLITDRERDAAEMMPLVMRRVKFEREAESFRLSTVAVPER